MDVYNRRIELEEATAIVQAAHGRDMLAGQSSAIFHHVGLMVARIAALQAAFPTNALHTIAIKANPVLEVLRAVVRAGVGLEAASLEEVQPALAAGCPADLVVFDSPAKTVQDIAFALDRGIYLNADNFDELERIAAQRMTLSSTSLVGLRVNPMVGVGTIAHTSVAEASSKFGIPLAAERQAILNAFAEYTWLRGLHVHVGSQGCQLALLAEAVGRVAALRRDITRVTGRTISHVDIGGGLSTVYRAGELAPTPAEYRELLESRAAELFSSDVRLITEFGRAIHANCGIAVSRVEYVKPAQRLAIIHLGADFLLRPVYRPDDWKHEFFVLDHQGIPKKGPLSLVTIAGPLCFAGDVLAREIKLPQIEPGDWVVIRDVGAYTLSMWSRHCSRGIPAMLGYDPRETEPLRLLRRAETPQDIVRFWEGPSRCDRDDLADGRDYSSCELYCANENV